MNCFSEDQIHSKFILKVIFQCDLKIRQYTIIIKQNTGCSSVQIFRLYLIRSVLCVPVANKKTVSIYPDSTKFYRFQVGIVFYYNKYILKREMSVQ